MSKFKRFLPATVIPGSRMKVDKHGAPEISDVTIKERPGSPLSIIKKGSPIFIMPKPAGFALHFRNEAAKRRTVAHMASQGIAGPADIRYAAPKDIVHVPLWRGLDARLANNIRGMIRANERKSKLQRLADAIKDKLKGTSADNAVAGATA
jgi:hypothetical protein